MSFAELDHLTDGLLVELETDLEPAFNRQSAAVLQQDNIVCHNQDWCIALQHHLESMQARQSALEDHERMLERQLSELEQSISTLEKCPRQVWPWCVGGTTSRAGSRHTSPLLAGLFKQRNDLYQCLLKLPTEMEHLERSLLPHAKRLQDEIDDYRRDYEKRCPIVGVMASHTELLLSVKRQLDVIDGMLIANTDRLGKFGLGGEQSMRSFFAALFGNMHHEKHQTGDDNKQ